MARMHVPIDALRGAADLLDSLADGGGHDGSADLVMPGLARLVGCDVMTYNEIGPGAGQVFYSDHPAGFLNPATIPVFAEHVDEHPLVTHMRATGDTEPVMISDFVGRREFHNLGIYSEFFRHIPVEHQIAFSLPGGNGQVVGIALSRAQKDFTETDRAVLSAMAGPLNRAMRRGRSRHQATSALAEADSDAMADLTDREQQVLELAAQGRTNQAIARTIGVSPRTIAKHLEHAYRKLGVTSRAAAVYRTATGADPGQATLPGGAARPSPARNP
jgi:DNA-binding CsgD family transcriptional regulator